MRTAVLDTSIDAFRRIPNAALKTQGDRIHDIVVDQLKAGQGDMSLQEIKAAYWARWGTRIELSSVSGRVNALVTAGRLQRLESTRPCTVTAKSIHPVCIPLVQRGLFS